MVDCVHPGSKHFGGAGRGGVGLGQIHVTEPAQNNSHAYESGRRGELILKDGNAKQHLTFSVSHYCHIQIDVVTEMKLEEKRRENLYQSTFKSLY